MRGCLTFITLWLVVALLAIWFALPPVINGVADAGLSAAGFSGFAIHSILSDPNSR